jgi:hypothetical protein
MNLDRNLLSIGVECPMPTPPRPSLQADGSPDSLHKTQKPDTDRINDRPPRTQSDAGDKHLGAEEDQVSDTSAPAGSAYADEPKQG